MSVQNWFARLRGQRNALSAEDAALQSLAEAGDRARKDGQYETALERYENGLKMARAQSSQAGEEVFLGLIGTLQTEFGKFEEAEQSLQESVALTEKLGNPERRARALGNLGAHYLRRGLPQKAQTTLEQALEIARSSNSPAIIGLTLANLGGVYLRQNNASYAIRLLREAAEKLQGTPVAYQSGAVAFAVGLFGQAHLMINEADRGFRLLTQAIRLAQQAGDIAQELRWTSALASGLFDAGQLQDSLKLYERCEELASRVTVPDEGYHDTGLLNRATIHFRVGQFDMALSQVQRVLSQAQSEANRSLEAKVQTLLGEIYRAINKPTEAVKAVESAVNLYETGTFTDKEAHGDALLTLGALYNANGDPERALQTFNAALELADSTNGLARAKALRRIGTAYNERGELQKSLDYWGSALELFEQSGQASMAARVICDIGMAKRALGGINAALPDYERATVILNSVKDAATRGLVLSNVANLYTDLGETETAASFFQEAIQLARQTGDRRSESLRLGNYGWFFLATGRADNAIRMLEEALAISRSMGDNLIIAVQTNNLAQAYHLQKDYTTARELFRQALTLADLTGDARWKAVFQTTLARTVLAQGQPEEALELVNAALPVSRSLNDQENIIRTLARLGEIHLNLDHREQADTFALEAESLARKWGYRKGQADALSVRAQVARLRGKAEEATRLSNEAIKLYTILRDPLAQELQPQVV